MVILKGISDYCFSFPFAVNLPPNFYLTFTETVNYSLIEFSEKTLMFLLLS